MRLYEFTNYTSPSGAKITTYFETSQGSKYVLSANNESKRLKSFHANTGGDDQGLKDWFPNCVFVPEAFQYEANCVQFLAPKIGGTNNMFLSTKNGKAAFYKKGQNGFEVLTWDDAYPKSNRGTKPLMFEYTETPTKGYHALEYKLNTNHSIASWHFGSDVSVVKDFADLTPDEIQSFHSKK
jgi:hypothetical protein